MHCSTVDDDTSPSMGTTVVAATTIAHDPFSLVYWARPSLMTFCRFAVTEGAFIRASFRRLRFRTIGSKREGCCL
jgi:hypothetical protein